MNPLSFLLVCVISFLFGVLLGVLSKPQKSYGEPFADLKPQKIVYEISDMENSEQRNFLSYDGSEQN